MVCNTPSDDRKAIHSFTLLQPVRHTRLRYRPCSLKFAVAIPVHSNTRTLFASEEPSGTTHVSTLTMPTIDGASTVGLNTRETHPPTQDRLSVHLVDE